MGSGQERDTEEKRRKTERQAQRRNENNEQLPKSMLKYLRCCAALPDAKFCVSLQNIKTHLAGSEGGREREREEEGEWESKHIHFGAYKYLLSLIWTCEWGSLCCCCLWFTFIWASISLTLSFPLCLCMCVKIDFLLSKKEKKVKNNKSLNTHTRLWTGFDKRRAQSSTKGKVCGMGCRDKEYRNCR